MRNRAETEIGRPQTTAREVTEDAREPELETGLGGHSMPARSESSLGEGLLSTERRTTPSRTPADAPMGATTPLVELDLGIRSYLRLFLRYRILIVACVLVTLALNVTRVLIAPRLYVAKATILPSGNQTSGVMGLIAGFTGTPPLGSLVEENTSLLFPSILESRAVGLEVLTSRYQFTLEGRAVDKTLEEYLDAENTDAALKALETIRSFDVNKESGLLTIAASTPYPDLSAQIANHYVASLERINMEMRQASATQNRSFFQERLAQNLKELKDAEQKVADFQGQNVRMNSPDLTLELMRLQRDVQIKQQVFATLAAQEEAARIEEAKNLPVVRVLDRAAEPKLPVPIPRISTLLIGLIAGSLVAFMAVAGVEVLHYLRREWALCTPR